MPASALPVFTTPTQVTGQQPLKSVAVAGSSSAGSSFSQMFGQAQSKGKTAIEPSRTSQASGTKLPKGKELPSEPQGKAGQSAKASEAGDDKVLPQNDNNLESSVTSATPVSSDESDVQVSQQQATQPLDAGLVTDPDLAAQLAALGLMPSQSEAPQESEISDVETSTDLGLWLQATRGQGWTLERQQVEQLDLAVDDLPPEQVVADESLLPTDATEQHPARTEVAESQYHESPDLESTSSDQVRPESQTQVQAQVQLQSQARTEIPVETGVETPVQQAPAQADDIGLSPAVNQAFAIPDTARAREVMEAEPDMPVPEIETDAQSSPPKQAKAASVQPQDKELVGQGQQADKPAVAQDMPPQPQPLEASQAPQEGLSTGRGQAAAAESADVTLRGQPAQSPQAKATEKMATQTGVASTRPAPLAVGREFQLTNEDHSGYQAASNEQAERQVSETGNQDAVKGFGHLLGAGMARLQPEAMTSTRSPLAELPSQLRSLDTPVGTKAWGQGVGERIQWMLSNGASSAEIRLNPQHLGPLEIRISLHNDQTQVSILAQHGATRDAIEASLPRLREMFQESNLNLGNVDVGRREAQTQQQGPGQQQGQGSEGKGRGFFAGADEELGADALAGQIRRVSTALIDDFA